MNSLFKIFSASLLVLLLAVTAYITPRLIFNNSLQNWLSPDSEIINDYKTFLKKFDTDALIMVSIVNSSAGDQDSFSQSVDSIINRVSQLEHVQSARRWPPPLLRFKTNPAQNIHSFYITFLPKSHLNPNRPSLVSKLMDLLEMYNVEYHVVGTGIVHKAINDLTNRAAKKYLGIGIAVLLILLVIVIRDIRILMKTIGASLGSVCTVLLSAYILKIEFNLIMTILPCLILFYTTSISIHILNHHGDIKKVLWPTLIAVFTTCAGFSAFLLDSSPLIRDFGLLAIAGLIGGLFWTLMLFYPGINLIKTEFPFKSKLFVIEKWWNIRTFSIGIILFIILIPGAFRIRSEIDILATLPKNHQTVLDYHFIEKHVGPFVPIEYQIEINNADIHGIRSWIDTVYQLEKVGAVMSYLSFPPWLNPIDFGYISDDGNTGRVVFYIPVGTTTEGLEIVHQIDDLAKKLLPENHFYPKPTGYTSLYVSVADNLTRSFKKSLLLAFVFVFLILFIYLRNFRLFLAAVLPNLFPVLAILGVMGWFHISLDMVTIPMGCLALGIIVDDTVHFLYWYRKSGDTHIALDKAGPGTVLTTIIFIMGFSVFLFAESIPVRYFGILTITAMITALFGDIVILPFILNRLGQKNNNA